LKDMRRKISLAAVRADERLVVALRVVLDIAMVRSSEPIVGELPGVCHTVPE
jgi:hypothetical protein